MMEEFKSLKGKFLIASPSVDDDIFGGSVILLIEHTPKRAAGLILNRSLKGGVYRLPDPSAKKKSPPILELYMGGPVEQKTMFILHSNSDLSNKSHEILPNVFLGKTSDILDEIVNSSHQFHLFFGYSTWQEQQLEKEIVHNDWIVCEPEYDLIFHTKIQYTWRESLYRQGGVYSYFSENVNNPKFN